MGATFPGMLHILFISILGWFDIISSISRFLFSLYFAEAKYYRMCGDPGFKT